MKKKKPLLNKKSMPWKIDKRSGTLHQALLVIIASFFLSGCATKPWTEPLKQTEAGSVRQLVDSLVARDAECGGTLEGDLVLSYQNPFGKKALSGFLRFSMPSSYRFVMTNPFGQPVLVIAGDQKSFQAINTIQRNYMAGSLRSFFLRNDIPIYFLQGNWGGWLTGRNLLPGKEITDIRVDRESRGVWLSYKSKGGIYHLLFDPERKIFPIRVLEDDKGRKVAEISYNKWINLAGCSQPREINIAGLDYGTDIHIDLSNVSLSDERKDYRLQPPPGYSRQIMP